MKFIFLTLLMSVVFTVSYAQDNFQINSDNVKTENITLFNYADGTDKKQKNPIFRFWSDIDSTQTNYSNNHPNSKFKILFGGKTLNLLFANKLATNFNNSNDLSLQQSYFNINAAEKSFSLGYNIDNRKSDPLKQLNWILSIGAKVIADNDFATIATGGDLEENSIGFNFKFSYINNGRIGWKTSTKDLVDQNENDKKKIEIYNDQRKMIEKNREFLNYKYDKKVKDYNKNELPVINEKNIEIYGDSLGKIKTQKAIKEKSSELLFEMIKEEIDYVESNELYTTIFNSWWTIEAYIPVGDKEYDITPIDENNKPKGVLFYPFNANVSYNLFKQNSSDFSYFGKFTGTLKGNSNIDVNGLKSKEFQSITTNDGIATLTAPVSAIDVSEFDRFITTTLKAELAFFYRGWIGFSPAIEKNFGTYDEVNWKLGVPFSLKDKEGKPTVNFELQWRETKTLIGSNHLFGFSTSFFFGDLIK